jgi:hypothetical protein
MTLVVARVRFPKTRNVDGGRYDATELGGFYDTGPPIISFVGGQRTIWTREHRLSLRSKHNITVWLEFNWVYTWNPRGHYGLYGIKDLKTHDLPLYGKASIG